MGQEGESANRVATLEATGALEASEVLETSEVLEALEESSVEVLVDVEADVKVEASEVLEAVEESSVEVLVEVLVDVKVEHTAKGLMEDLVEDKSDPFRKVEMYATPLYAYASEKHAVTKSNTTLPNHLCSNT